MENGKIWRHFDFQLFGGVALLIIFGSAMIRSTLLSSPDGGAFEMGRHLMFVAVGIPLVMVVTALDYRMWGNVAGAIYAVLIVLLLLVELLAQTRYGAARWLDIGGFLFQPSELGKFLITLSLGHFIVQRVDQLGRFTVVAQTLLHVGVPMFLIFIEPDLSTSVIYAVIWFTLMWVAGLRLRHLAVLGSSVAAALPIGFWTVLNTPALNYQADRLVHFFIPDTGSVEYQDATYNVNQALISIGSGGLFGQGYGNGSQVQLRFLKVRHTDFIFSALSNEFGLVGAVIVIALIAFVVYRIFRAGALARDLYGKLICYGVGMIILYQSFFNIGMNLKLLPVSGIPLPFVSYGGSALWTFLFGIGLVQSVVLRHRKIEF